MVKGAKLYSYWSNIKQKICHQGSFSPTEQLKPSISEKAFCAKPSELQSKGTRITEHSEVAATRKDH